MSAPTNPNKLLDEHQTKKVAERERKAAEQWAKEQTAKLQAERDNALEKAAASAAKEAVLCVRIKRRLGLPTRSCQPTPSQQGRKNCVSLMT